MFDITCLDKNKNVITRFTQWDKNQSITIEIDYEWTEAPEFHFCNKNSKEAIVVKSVLSENRITAIVPDTLLQEPFPIIVYIYEIDNTSGRSVASIKLPVIPRLAPSNYILASKNGSIPVPEAALFADAVSGEVSDTEFTSFDDYFTEE